MSPRVRAGYWALTVAIGLFVLVGVLVIFVGIPLLEVVRR